MAGSNGSKGVVLWIATGLAAAAAGLFLSLLTGISGDVTENRQTGQEHAERIRAVEIIGEGVRRDITEIKESQKTIERKLDRALERDH